MTDACTHCGGTHDDVAVTCARTGLRLDTNAPRGPCGTTVDRYRVERLLGEGGFSSVYRATHVNTGQVVALKILKSQLAADPQMLDRLFREARAAAAIDDPRVVRVTDSGLAATGEAFIAMEMLDGLDLRDAFQRSGELTPRRVVEVMVDVLDGLAAAHARGIVHRDLKPANVFLARSGGREQVKLLDFGISKLQLRDRDSDLTRSNMAMGTPTYMAPEQMRSARDVDARADLWSVATMAYELLAGAPPFGAVSYEEMVVKVCTAEIAPLASRAPNLPSALCATIDRGLVRDLARRWPDAPSFAAALRASLQDTPVFPPLRPTLPPAEPPLEKTLASPLPSPSVAPAATPVVAGEAAPAKPGVSRGGVAMMVALFALPAMGLGAYLAARMSPAPVVVPPPPQAEVKPEPKLVQPPAQVDEEPDEPDDPDDVVPAPPPPKAKPPLPPPKPKKPLPKQPARPVLTGPVTIHEPNIVGQLDYAAVKALFEAAHASLDECRRRETVTVHVHLHTHGTGVSLARDDPNQHNDDLEAARCVANHLKHAASKGWESGGSGIIAVSVTLAAR